MTRLPWLQPGSDDSVWNKPIGSSAQWNVNPNDPMLVDLRHAGTINCANNGNGNAIYIGNTSDSLIRFVSTSSAQDIPRLSATMHCPTTAVPSTGNGGMDIFDQASFNKLWSWAPCTFNDQDSLLDGVTSVYGEVNDPTGVMEDQVTGKWGHCAAIGAIRAWELDPQQNPSLRIAHMLAFTTNSTFLTTLTTIHTSVTPLPWPCTHTDNEALTPSSSSYYNGHLPAGVTIGIPSYVEMPTNLSTGGQILWAALQEFGAIWRGSNTSTGICFAGEPSLEGSTYIAGMRADLKNIVQYLCILTNQGPLTKNGGGRLLAAPPEPLDPAYGGTTMGGSPSPPQASPPPSVTVVPTTWSTTDKTSSIVLSNSNLTAKSVGSVNQGVRSSTSKSDGRFYFEIHTDAIGADFAIGIANNIYPLAGTELGSDANSLGFYPVNDQAIYFDDILLSLGENACLAGDVINVALDFTNRLIWCSSAAMRQQNYGSNTWNSSSTANPVTGIGGISFAGMQGPFFVTFNDDHGDCTATVNFGLSAFTVAAPDGFASWDVPATPIPALPPIVPALATGQFYVANGKIYDPAGNQFIAAGLNIGDATKGSQYLSLFPAVNFFRIALGGYDTPSTWIAFVNQMTTLKIVCEFEHHPWPLPSAYSGSTLTTESTWYASMATAFKTNPYVWFGSMNEPQGGDITAQQVSTYNAIRNAGAPNMILMETGVGSGNPNQTGSPTLTASSYASMTNIVWDLHYYGWTTGFSTNVTTVRNELLGSVASQTGILAAQGITSRDGLVPVINAEFGVSTSGTSMDANAAQDIDAVTNWAIANNYTSGFAGWHWDADPFNAVQNNGTLTSWGTSLAAAMVAVKNRLAAIPVPPPSTPPPAPPPALGESTNGTQVSTVGPVIVGVNGNTWGLNSSGYIVVNGVADTVTTSNVILLVYLNHLVYQENSALGWWYKSVPTDVWTATTNPIIAPPPAPPPVTPPPASPPSVALRTWFLNPGMDGSFWVCPFYDSAQWITTGSVLTQLRNGNNGSPTGYVHTNITNDFVVPYWIGRASDPLIPITSGSKTINVRIPVGAVTEQPYTGVDNCIWGADSTQPYLIWTANNAVINTGSIQSSGSSISCGSIQTDDGAGQIMTDAVTGQPGGGNGYGVIQDYELSAANADSNYVIPHMLAYSLDPNQVNTTLVWPLKVVDTSATLTGSVSQGNTIGIPANIPRPTGKSRGFYLLFDNAQQYGWMFYNLAANGCLSLGCYHTTAANATLTNDIASSINEVMQYLCILSNQSGISSLKGMAPGGKLAYTPPPLLDLSPSGNINIAPSTFGAWYPSGYNAIPTNTISSPPVSPPAPPPVPPPVISPPPSPPPAAPIMSEWWTAMTAQLAANADIFVLINTRDGDPQGASGSPDEGVINTPSAGIIGTFYKSFPIS